MIYLLDVNLLIALVDENHVHFSLANDWFRQMGKSQWATCPMTENGFLRILSSRAYPLEFNRPGQVFDLLRKLCADTHHRFWPDDFSLLDLPGEADQFVTQSRNITDLYLLALAIRHEGRLATLDQRIPARQVEGGDAALFVVRP